MTYYAVVSALIFAVVAVGHVIRILNRWAMLRRAFLGADVRIVDCPCSLCPDLSGLLTPAIRLGDGAYFCRYRVFDPEAATTSPRSGDGEGSSDVKKLQRAVAEEKRQNRARRSESGRWTSIASASRR
jgi:hypothetical protein